MGCADPERPIAADGESSIGRAFGAMAVQDVGFCLRHPSRHVSRRGHIGKPDLSRHRDPGQSKWESRFQLLEHSVRKIAAGRRIADDADLVTMRQLSSHDVDHMSEKPANRRAEDMNDSQTGACADHLSKVDQKRLRRINEGYAQKNNPRQDLALKSHRMKCLNVIETIIRGNDDKEWCGVGDALE